jgi:hypothetical protein
VSLVTGTPDLGFSGAYSPESYSLCHLCVAAALISSEQAERNCRPRVVNDFSMVNLSESSN